MAAAGGSQCGYCTPGFVMSLFAEQYRPGPRRAVRSAGAGRQSVPLHRLPSDSRCRAGARSARRPVASRDRLDAAGAARSSAVSVDGFSRPSTVDECVATARGRSRRDAHRRRHGPRRRVEPARPALAAPGQRRGDRRAARRSTRRADASAIGAALPLTDIGRRWHGAPDGRSRVARRCSRRRRSATAPRSAATSPRPRRSATPRRCCWRSMRACTSPGRAGAATCRSSSFFTGYRQTALQPGELLTAIEIPKPLPQRRALLQGRQAAARRHQHRRGGDGDRSRRRAAACGARGSRSAASPPRRCASSAAEDAVVGQPWNEAAVERVQQRPRAHADADERPSRVARVPARGVEEPGREVLVGVAVAP